MVEKENAFLTRMGKLGITPEILETFFSNMGLPLPKKTQYLVTSDEGAMIFLNDVGVVLRFGSNKKANHCFDVRHPSVLQPIVQLDHENLHVEILPGVRLGNDHSDLHTLTEELAAAGLQFEDKHTKVENIGYLPDGVAVIIDRNAVHATVDYKHEANDEKLPLAHMREVLKKFFLNACPNPFQKNSASNPMVFWGACKKFKENEQLASGWMDEKFHGIIYYANHGQTSMAQEKSINYAPDVASHWDNLRKNIVGRSVI